MKKNDKNNVKDLLNKIKMLESRVAELESKNSDSSSNAKAVWKIKPFTCSCGCESFKINKKDADHEDFGELEDRDHANAKPYSCKDMHFTPKPATDEVLKKYNISLSDYNAIAEDLEEKLSIGSCGMCV